MDPKEMLALIERHMKAETSKDVDGALAVYTDDIEHDTVGWPTGPLHGEDQVRDFYEYLTANIDDEDYKATRTYFAPNACTIEHEFNGAVTGEFMGIPGNGRRITFRMLHIFEFRDGKICRENVWLDGATIAAQLTAA
jgi:steroid delta-isomerase-like uncharacterized protein